MEDISIGEIITGVSGIFTALLVIAGIVVKFTKTKKDDEVLAQIKGVTDPVLEAVDPKKPKV